MLRDRDACATPSTDTSRAVNHSAVKAPLKIAPTRNTEEDSCRHPATWKRSAGRQSDRRDDADAEPPLITTMGLPSVISPGLAFARCVSSRPRSRLNGLGG